MKDEIKEEPKKQVKHVRITAYYFRDEGRCFHYDDTPHIPSRQANKLIKEGKAVEIDD